jgi:hypothetical protein
MFGDMNIFDLFGNHNKLSVIAKDALKPILSTAGWLEDQDIHNALNRYSNDPQYHFQHYIVRPAVGLLESDPMYDFSERTPPPSPGVTKLAFIFNTSPVDLGGSHWVMMFADITEDLIEYIDPYGRSPNPSVSKNITSVLKFLKKSFPGFKKTRKDLRILKKQKQLQAIECGVYCVHYSITRAKGVSFDVIEALPLTDSQVELFRRVYWRAPQN